MDKMSQIYRVDQDYKGHVFEFIDLIKKLYAIEAKARSDGRTPDQLYEIWQIKSVPILEKI